MCIGNRNRLRLEMDSVRTGFVWWLLQTATSQVGTSRYSTAFLGGDGEDKHFSTICSCVNEWFNCYISDKMIAKWLFSTSISGLMKGINTDSDKLFPQALRLHDKRGVFFMVKRHFISWILFFIKCIRGVQGFAWHLSNFWIILLPLQSDVDHLSLLNAQTVMQINLFTIFSLSLILLHLSQ